MPATMSISLPTYGIWTGDSQTLLDRLRVLAQAHSDERCISTVSLKVSEKKHLHVTFVTDFRNTNGLKVDVLVEVYVPDEKDCGLEVEALAQEFIRAHDQAVARRQERFEQRAAASSLQPYTDEDVDCVAIFNPDRSDLGNLARRFETRLDEGFAFETLVIHFAATWSALGRDEDAMVCAIRAAAGANARRTTLALARAWVEETKP